MTEPDFGGAEGGWGLWWGLWWGLGARVGGQGSDEVMEFLPRRATQLHVRTASKNRTPRGTVWLTCTRAAVEN